MIHNGKECLYIPYFTETNEFLLAFNPIFSPKKIRGNSPAKEKQHSYRHTTRYQCITDTAARCNKRNWT
jgi:hypothetical protein